MTFSFQTDDVFSFLISFLVHLNLKLWLKTLFCGRIWKLEAVHAHPPPCELCTFHYIEASLLPVLADILSNHFSLFLLHANTHRHFSASLTVTIRPLSWKYLTRGMVFCLKLVRRRSMALGLSSGRPCCSARFCSLSFKRWLVQARNTTKSGVQICRGREDVLSSGD